MPTFFFMSLLAASLSVVVYASRTSVADTIETDCLISACDQKQYLAGYAEIDISPEIGIDMVPTMTSAPQLLKQIHDPLYAKAVVLSDGQKSIAFVALDLCFLMPESFESLRQHLINNSAHDYIVLTLTHTHSGIFDDRRIDQLKISALAALSAANMKLKPVEIGASSTVVDEAYNRRIHLKDSVEMLWQNPLRNFNRMVDNALGVIHIRTLDDKPYISMVNYSAHPTVTMDLENVVVSADYPGAIASSVSRQLGGHVIFLTGAAGDVNPYDSGTKPLAMAIQKSNALGEKLALAAVSAINTIDNYTSHGSLLFSSIELTKPTAEIGSLMLTKDIALATFPGEYFNHFGEQLKSKSPFTHTFFIGYSNGSIGYVPSNTAMLLGGYGADSASVSESVSSSTGQQHTDAAIDQLKAFFNAQPF
jgi:hypothetical protein